jgi:MFS superfamily sulfate permease-like transporter
MRERIAAEAVPPHLVVIDLSAAAYVDMQAAHALVDLATELRGAGARVRIVEARASVRQRLRAEGVDEQLGGVNRFTTIADAVENCTTEQPGPAAAGQ